MSAIKRYFYLSSLFLSGSCLVIMSLLILSQILARTLGLIIPSSEDFAGWLLSATIFFGLAYTFNQGGHIRVTILFTRLKGRAKRYIELVNLIIAALISSYLMFYTAYTVYDSYIYEEVSDTYVAMSLWIVQLPMAVGSAFLFIAIIDNFIDSILGKKPAYLENEETLSAED